MNSLHSQSWGYSVQTILNKETGKYEYEVKIQWMGYTHVRDGFQSSKEAFDYVDFIQEAGLDYVKSLN